MARAWGATVVALTLVIHAAVVWTQPPRHLMKAAGSPVTPKVSIVWNRYYDAEALGLLMHRIAKAYPRLAKIQSLGRSYEGREIWCLTITDFRTGDPAHKPGAYVEGNMHGGELQGAEFSLYIAWYLTESFNDVPAIRALLAQKVIYIVPTVNPDARDNYIHRANEDGSSRFTMKLLDDYGDRTLNTDGGSDVDGDGTIAMMRIKDPYGIYRIDPTDALRMSQLAQDSIVHRNGVAYAKYPDTHNYDYRLESRDRVAPPNILFRVPNLWEYDLNRHWGWSWGPADTAFTAATKPWFPQIETRRVRDFLLQHLNIAVAESFHNSAGEIYVGSSLRQARQDSAEQEPPTDLGVYDTLGSHAEQLLPGYQYRRVDPQTRKSFPGTNRDVDWMFGARGIYAFLTELMTERLFFQRRPGEVLTERDWWREHRMFLHELLFDDPVIPWHLVQHPALGPVEIGGEKKNCCRLHPGFLMEADAHRHMAFFLSLVLETPHVSVQSIAVRLREDGQQEVTVTVANTGLMPTHSGPDMRHAITRPDYITLCGVGQVEITNISGHGRVTVQWSIPQRTHRGPYHVIVDSVRGGIAVASTDA